MTRDIAKTTVHSLADEELTPVCGGATNTSLLLAKLDLDLLALDALKRGDAGTASFFLGASKGIKP